MSCRPVLVITFSLAVYTSVTAEVLPCSFRQSLHVFVACLQIGSHFTFCCVSGTHSRMPFRMPLFSHAHICQVACYDTVESSQVPPWGAG
jgi:hypothetical protein